MNIVAFLRHIISDISPITAAMLKVIPDTFQAAIDFLETEPISNYSIEEIEPYKYPLPLTLKKDSIERIKSKELLIRGKTKNHFNMIYVIGQYLTHIANVLDLYTFKDNNGEFKDLLDLLYKIWGNHNNMRAEALADTFHDKSHQFVRHVLLKKMKATIKLFNEQLLPYLKAQHPKLF